MDTFDEKQLLEQSIAYGEGCRQQNKKKQIHMELLNEPLKHGDFAGFIKVFHELSREPFAACDENLDYMSVVQTIHEKEIGGKWDLFLPHFTSVDEIMDFITAFKFKLWRMEFYPDEQEERRFYNWWKGQQLSIVALYILIQCYSMKKVDTLVTLAIYKVEDKAFREALHLLYGAEKIMPNNEIIVGAISQVMKLMGGTDGQS